ncbi:MAG: hypothetical protein K9G11_01175 [Rickettsiaceae bacterium]|nr:hypothetical protein [Rickettsiaceae bacterium]
MYVEKSVVLDCHGANASRNNASALPLEDVSTILKWPECLSVIVLCHHEPRAKRCERGDPVINFF